jgi:ribonucleoside-diphosphate reductase alpha chain
MDPKDFKFELTPFGQIVWEDRYALKDENGNKIEDNILENFKRVAKAIASKEKDSKKWEKKFYEIMASKYFSPAGRILAHAGTHYSQLLNCFVLPFKDDSLESIMDTAKHVAVVQKFGGGVGLSYSTLRPSGSHIKGVNGHSCGVPGFINMLSVVSEVIEQGGCLTYDTLINTLDGTLYLGEIIGKSDDQGWYDHNIVVKTKDGDQKSNRFYINGYSDVLKIDTDCGIILKGTPSHKIYVMAESGPIWKEFKDIRRGDWLIATLGQHTGSIQSLYTNVPKRHHNCIIPERLPETLDASFAFFLGYYLGNGFSTSSEHDHRFGVSIPDKSHLNARIESIFKDFFGNNIGVTAMKKENDCSSTYYVSNRMVKEYLNINGLLKNNSLEASIPLKIRKSPVDIIASFIGGLFEADGALRHGYPMLSTASSKLAHEVQTLFFGIGIPTKIELATRTGAFSTNPIYNVSVVSPKGLEAWSRLIPHDSKSRFSECTVQDNDDINQRWYILPYASYWLGKALEHLPRYKMGSGVGPLRKEILRIVNGKRRLTLSSFNRLKGRISKYYPETIDYPEVGNQFFLQVTGTVWEEDFTADLEVENSHSYLANGIVSHNSRRGANMGLLEVSHPDVWEFISYKTEHNWDHLREFIDVRDEEKWSQFKFENNYKLQMYNVSIGVTDEFFEALKKDDVWPLVWKGKDWDLYTVQFRKMRQGTYTDTNYEVTADSDKTALWKVKKKIPFPTAQDSFEVISKRKIKASEIWEKICYNAWADGCPGLINLSTARKYHNLEYAHPLTSTNPCGEQPISDYSSCNLSSILLSSFVKPDKTIDYDALKTTVQTAVRFADDVIDNCEFPIPEIKRMANLERRVGVGVLGAHDMLIELGQGYDTDEGRSTIERVLTFMRDTAYMTSIELAKEKGPFPAFDKEKIFNSHFIKTLPKDIRDLIEKYGLRNSTLLSIAPTGTIGALFNSSTGCEPWFSLAFQRNTRLGSYEDGCPAYIKWKSAHPGEPKPSYFKTAQEISPEDHIKMMVLFSKYVDSAVSKTVNLPNSATVEDIKRAFLFAMENGAKGITVFRDGSKEGVFINKDAKKVTVAESKQIIQDLQHVKEEENDTRVAPKKRGDRVVGATTRIHMQKHNLYVTVNRNKEGEIIEVFATVGESKEPDAHHTSGVEDSWAESLGKMISLALRAGVKPDSIVRNLKNIPSDKPVFHTIGDCESSEPIPSPPHAIARVIEEELKYSCPVQHKMDEKVKKGGPCQECGSTNTIQKATCSVCNDCGYSGCGS